MRKCICNILWIKKIVYWRTKKTNNYNTILVGVTTFSANKFIFKTSHKEPVTIMWRNAVNYNIYNHWKSWKNPTLFHKNSLCNTGILQPTGVASECWHWDNINIWSQIPSPLLTDIVLISFPAVPNPFIHLLEVICSSYCSFE